jgi:hypothetical protein
VVRTTSIYLRPPKPKTTLPPLNVGTQSLDSKPQSLKQDSLISKAKEKSLPNEPLIARDDSTFKGTYAPSTNQHQPNQEPRSNSPLMMLIRRRI